MKTILLSKSSDGPPYEVTFVVGEKGELIVTCSCRAGQQMQQCKHKRNLTMGDASMLFDQSQITSMTSLFQSDPGKRLRSALVLLEDELKSVDDQKQKLQAEEKQIKAGIGRLFSRGRS